MLVSVALVIIVGLLLGSLAQKVKLPSLIGLLFTGIILGPYCLNLLSSNFLDISSDLRTIALIVILTRAGLALDLADLKKVGRPAVLMCFVPALFEIVGTVILAPTLLHISISEALLLGSVIAAVSPAVVVPRMIRLMREGYGVKKRVPQIILAGASVDDVFVLVLFTAFLGLNEGGNFSAVQLTSIPIAILSGASLGFLLGYLLVQFFNRIHIRDSIKVLLMLAISFLLMGMETSLKSVFPFSGMLAVMSLSLMIFRQKRPLAERLSVKFNKIWIIAEIFLFVLVGASVDLSYAVAAGVWPIVLLILISLFRMLGVYVSLLHTNLTFKERVFCMMSYLPKATVQAAIGAIPLSLGLASGEIILTVAVLSILLTAPIGAWLMDRYYSVLLENG
ncbi:cation:proton antiporter [Granulicatella seriolae]|uniref:Cation:proton antiporter n=1 Tax=Granulicatella seriolae TaxID=2967226 RepID=A0ABT1WLI6_9LACT|nr:cation:proton antiporter [Granulicatella seriolae]